MIVDTRNLSVFNINKKLELDLYVVSCFENRKFSSYYSYTTYNEAKELYDNIINLKTDKDIECYLNKYSLIKSHLESNNQFFLDP